MGILTDHRIAPAPRPSPLPTPAAAAVRPAIGPDRPTSQQPWWHDMVISRALKFALSNLVIMSRNVLVSAVVTLASALLIGRGIELFLTAPTPPRTGFVMWSLFLTHFLSSLFNVVVHSYSLMKFKFVACEGKRPSFAHCVKRIVAGTWIHHVGSLLVLLAVGLLCTSSIYPQKADDYKIEFYAEVIVDQMFHTSCQLQSRAIFFNETIQGQEKAQSGAVRRQQLDVSGHKKLSSFAALRRFVRAFAQTIPSLVSIFIAGVYVHIVSQWQHLPGFNTQWFVGGSLLLKLTMQEIAKHYLIKTHATNLHHMCIVVSVPTVLIDTQVRVVILASQAAQSTLRSSYILAAIEVSVRLLKIAFLHRAIRKKQQARSKVDEAFHLWRDQVVALHIAETQADMYSEYVAIVCSGVIALLWSRHPLYTLSDYTEMMRGGVLVTTLLYQVAIELAVDYCGSSLEIYYGVGMAEDDKRRGRLGSFLGFFVAMLAVMNINMSAVLYIRPRSPQG